MSIAIELFKKYWPGLALLTVLVFGYVSGYQNGTNKAVSHWQSKWDEHALADSEAKRLAEANERAKEQAHQAAMNKVIKDGQQKINAVIADAAADADSSRGMRGTIDQLTAELDRSEASNDACITASSKAAAKTARVLADVLKRADQRASVLAAAADQAIERGSACESAYDAVADKSNASIDRDKKQTNGS